MHGKYYRKNVFSNQVSWISSQTGKAVGAVIDGCPANLELNTGDIQKRLLEKRKPRKPAE